MKTLDQRINNVIGQLEAVKKMAHSEEDCFNTLVQMKAVRSGVNSVIKLFLEEQVTKCIDSPKNLSNSIDKQKISQLLEEFLKN